MVFILVEKVPGYAGGIMSAAVDGIKCAIALLENG